MSLPENLTNGVSAWLDTTYLGSPPEVWAVAIGTFVAVFAVLLLVRHLLLTRLRGLVDRTRNIVDDLLLDLVRRTGWPFFLVVALLVGSMVLRLPPDVARAVRHIFTIVLFVQLGAWVNHVLSFSIDAYLKRSQGEDDGSRMAVVSLFNFFARVVVWSIVVLLVLDNIGVDVVTLIAGLGVGGIAIGLALQSVLRDTFASLSIILDKPFEVGDLVFIDEHAGTVEQVGLKTTRIRSLSGEELIFGNDDLLSSRIRNFKRMRERRVVFAFGVAHRTPARRLEEVNGMVRAIVTKAEGARFHRVHFKGFTDYALTFEVVYYVTTPDYDIAMDIQEAINLALHETLEERGIRLASPTQRVEIVGGMEGGRPLEPRQDEPGDAGPREDDGA